MLRKPNSDDKSKIVNQSCLSHIDDHNKDTNSIFPKAILKDPNKISFEKNDHSFIKNIFNDSFDDKSTFSGNHHLPPKGSNIERSSLEAPNFQIIQSTENSNIPDFADIFDHIENDNDISPFDMLDDSMNDFFTPDDFNETEIEPELNGPMIGFKFNNAEKGNLDGKVSLKKHVVLSAGQKDFKFMYYNIFVSRKKFPKKFVKQIHEYMRGPLNLPKMKREHIRNIDLYFQEYYHLSNKILVFLENNKLFILQKITGLSNSKKS